MSIGRRLSAASPRALVEVVLYVATSVLMLFPILASPVIADDFFNPFSQFDEVGAGMWAAVAFGWNGATQGASFRIVGNPLGAGFNWLWLWSAARLGVSMTTFFAVTKYVVLVSCAGCIAWCWKAAGEACGGRGPTLRSAFVWVSVVFFATLQIHAPWSNDPVANYPLAGYVAAGIGFLVIGAACRVGAQPTLRRIATSSVLATCAVLYYEINIGAVAGGALVLAYGCWRVRRGPSMSASLVALTVFVCVPASFILVGRSVTGGNTGTYAGTTVRLSGAPTTFARGFVSSLPGSAWRLSIQTLGGQLAVVFFVFATVFLVAWVFRWWSSSEPSADPTDADGSDIGIAVAVVCAIGLYASFALALQSITIKVQDEAPAVGYVYTWYAMTSCAVALGLAAAARYLSMRPASARVRYVAVGLGLSVLFVQNTVNWRLSEQLTTSYAANRRLLDAFDQDIVPVARCAALIHWQTIVWPDYYESGITDGIQEAFDYYFGEPFCPLIGPTD